MNRSEGIVSTRSLSIPCLAQTAIATLVAVAAATEPEQPSGIVLDQSPGTVSGVAFSPDGKLLAAAGTAERRAHLTIWDVESRTSDVYDFDARAATCVSFAPDGKTLALAVTDGRILFWDVAQRKELSVLYQRMVSDVTFSPDGKLLAAAGGDWRRPGKLILWDVETGRVVRRLAGHDDAIRSIAFSPDGRLIASASSLDGSVRVWEVDTGGQKHLFRMRAWSVAFSPDGTRLAGGGSPIVLWDPASGKELARHHAGGRAVPDSLAFSPDGRVLAAAGTGFDDKPGELWLLDLSAPGITARFLEIGDRGFRHVAVSPDGELLAVGSSSGTGRLQLWSLRRR